MGYNVADDEPMRRRDLANAIAKIEGVAPPALPEAMDGEVPGLIEALMRSQRISNKRFKKTTGWAPQYRSVLVVRNNSIQMSFRAPDLDKSRCLLARSV